MNLDERIVQGLQKEGITKLTKIQEECLLPGFEGKNIIGCSRTGTGKTLAFLLPVIMKNIESKGMLYAAIVVPTKELCIQICSVINQLSNNSGIPITAAALFSGVNKERQLKTLKSKPNIVVGTYERMNELIKERKLAAYQVKTLIIDEADKLLNKDNIEGIKVFKKNFMRDVQVMLFSASINDSVLKYSTELSDDFVKIFTDDKVSIPDNISHIYFIAEKRDKIEYVRKVINALNTKHCLIFSNSKFDTNEVFEKMEFHHYNVACIHSGLDKNKRRQIIDNFRSGKLEYLICSDIAARGLHFDNVDTVINIGMPDKTTDYLHRAGRCGRNGEKATCASIISENELTNIKACQKAFSINMNCKKLYQGKIVRK